MLSKKLMVLGAGPFQVPGIRKAVELGHYVISVDNRPESKGHRFSHQYLNCSTTRREELARHAKDLAIDGICTFSSDVAVPSVGYVCDRLGLPGITLATAELMSSKRRFREAQRREALPHPVFIAGQSLAELQGALGGLHFPLMFKPVDSSGSRGVRLLAQESPGAAESAFTLAKSFSSSETVCVEEFVPGRDFGGDGILLDGKLAFAAITDKHLEAFVVTGHSLPSSLGHDDQARVRRAIEDCCQAVGYSRGPLDFDVKVSPERVVVLEVSPRTGGNGVPAVICHAAGIDLEKVTIRFALGEDLLLPSTADADEHLARGAGSLIFGNRNGGTLSTINGFSQVKALVPELLELNMAVSVGETVRPFEHNGNLVGYAVFACESAARYAEIAAHIEQALEMHVEAS